MGPHEVHAVEVEHVLDVDVGDPGVGVRRPEDRRVEGAEGDVVDVHAATAEEAFVLDAVDLGAHQLAAHALASGWFRDGCCATSSTSEPASSAARSTAFTMFW